MYISFCRYLFFFFNDTAPTEIYTLPLHAALPISLARGEHRIGESGELLALEPAEQDRHEQRRHLVVGDAVRGVRGDQGGPLLRRKRTAVALALDERHDQHYRPPSSRSLRCAAPRPC